ncbi:MAG: GTP-binding protein [Muribaculaceae bacterium]|nr:GTP-binding protein [Muribaculaceae bacterium]
MKGKDLPVLLLTGYLGSGKTTLLNRILNNRRGIKFAVIVNDIGEVNIDAELIQKGGVVGGKDEGDLVALQNGCICCTLKMDLVNQLMEIADSGRFDYIVIEASGICEPEPIARTIAMIPQMVAGTEHPSIPRLDCIVTVVDALRMCSEFGNGDNLNKPQIAEDDIENLVIQQIEFCNIILLNKISEVSATDAKHIKEIIRALQPRAEIIDCDYADVDLSRLLDTGMFNYDSVATSAAWISELERPVEEEHDEDHHEHHHHHDDHDEDEHEHHHHEHEHEHHHHHHHDHDHEEGEAEEYGIGTFVYYRRKPFDLNKFDYFVGKQWPASVIRAKGILYFDVNPDMSFLFEQAGVQKKVTQAGQWFATAPEEELKEMMAADPTIQRDWDPVYGDRMIKLVFIGRKMDRHAIEAALDACLV